MRNALLVMTGAAFGGLARHGVAVALVRLGWVAFPFATLFANVTGCFGAGLAMGWIGGRPGLSEAWRLLIVVGFLGGYTTFSAFGWETFRAIRSGQPALGLLNILLNVTLGYAAVWLGATWSSSD